LTKLYIDAGHGGKDSGAAGNGIYEKNIVLAITKKTEAYLKANFKNIEIMLSRSGDTYPTLAERTNQANAWGADAYISIHINSSAETKARGFETFVHPDTDASTVSFQNVMHQEIWNQIAGVSGVNDRGKKRANFHVLRETNMKAILTECFFISNAADAALLKSDEFLDKLAVGHAQGVERFFGLERVRPPSGESDALYQVIAGTYSQYENAEAQVARLKKDGYSAYINKKD
jgi:N-acetylmuramoyl-L-alanine amidase